MGKANVYFIMYFVLLAELITIITERDILTKHEVKVKKKLINSRDTKLIKANTELLLRLSSP